MPLDPGSEWLAAGITGLPRQREWDAVATAAAPGSPGDEAEFVALPDGRLVLESGPPGFDPAPLGEAVGVSLEPPYRAVGVRRGELWAVGAVSIQVERLDPDPRGTDLALTSLETEQTLLIDRLPADTTEAAALERLARSREGGSWVANAHRLDRDLWEVSVLPL